MLHTIDGLFFKRTDDGSVRIIKTHGKLPEDAPKEIVADVTLHENAWASVVSTVSQFGETTHSWSAARAFHGANTKAPSNLLTFGEAIAALKAGLFIARTGWNGKGMYLWLMPESIVNSHWCREPHLKALAEANGGAIHALGTIRMKTADDKILTGWLASQSDILAEDWIIVEPST